MGPFGRFSGAALHCFFSLAALSCKTYVASGANTKGADGDGAFARLAEEHIRADPDAVTRVSPPIEADGSLLARQQEMNLHNIHTDVASEGHGDWHHGTSDDDRGVGQRVVIRADGSLDAGVVDDRFVRQTTLQDKGSRTPSRSSSGQVVELAEGQVVEDGSAGVSEHARRTRDGNDVILVVLIIFLIWGLISAAVLIFMAFKNSDSQPDWMKRLRPQVGAPLAPERAPQEVGDDRQPQSN